MLLTLPGAELAPESLRLLAGAMAESRHPWTDSRDAGDAQRGLPIREALVPVRGMFLFVLVFAGLVGPLNLFLLARWRRRMWLLVTVPALALLATAGVTAYAWLGEGVVRERSTLSLTLLDEGSHRAAIWSLAGVYATFTPGEGLRYSGRTEVTPLLGNTLGAPGLFGVDWSSEQRLVPGWLVARTPLHLLSRRLELRRERLLFTPTPDGLEVQNALGAPLERLAVRTGDGALYLGKRVGNGARGELERAPAAAKSPHDPAAELLEVGVAEAVRRMGADPSEFALPGTYVAVLAADPFSEEVLAGARTVSARAVVCGRLPEGTP
jgi:hypothetical protein